MKNLAIECCQLVFLSTTLFLASCDSDKDKDALNYLTPQQIFESNLCRNWDVESFLEDGIERVPELKSQDCYKAIRFKGGYDRILAGVNQNIDCNLSGSWGESNNLDSIILNFHNSPFIGIGPYGSDHYCNYKIDQLTSVDLKLSGQYNGSEYVITLKSF